MLEIVWDDRRGTDEAGDFRLCGLDSDCSSIAPGMVTEQCGEGVGDGVQGGVGLARLE